MSSITDFLRARYDEEEDLAKRCTPGTWKLWGMSVMADQDGTSRLETAVDVAFTQQVDDTGHMRTWNAQHIAMHDPEQVLRVIESNRKILEWHDNWPIMVSGPAMIEPVEPAFDATINSISFRMKQEINFLTTKEYVKRFSAEPPTTPILLIMAQPYEKHHDFDPDWLL